MGNQTIAEPHESTASRIGEIYENISNPIKVIPEFQFDVLGVYEEDYINEKGRNLDVLFITHNGKETEKLLGLVTISDLAPLI